MRVVEGVSGNVPMEMALRIRFDYGHIVPWVRNVGGQLEAVAGPDAVWPAHPRGPRGPGPGRRMRRSRCRPGTECPSRSTYRPSHQPRPTPADAEHALAQTEEFWARWMTHFPLRPGGWADAVRRSLITVKALTYAPTGGIAASATTSLPE